MGISFVVLHYQDIDVTKECIELLLNIKGPYNVSIVIVDNASPNNSGKKLKELYEDNHNNIEVIISEENLGFARGNNLGYQHCRNNNKLDFIVVMNNDVLIKQNDFIDQLKKVDSSIAIVAPTILNKKGENQNPFRNQKISTKKLRRINRYNKFIFLIYNIPGLAQLYLYLKINFISKNKKVSEKSTIKYNDIVPHGSCVIFTEEWIKHENCAFLPETFMYFEEDILYEYAMENSYKIAYVPTLVVNHLEDVSTKAVYQGELKKRRFISKNMIHSTSVLLEMRKSKIV